jgi:hypothetical protein
MGAVGAGHSAAMPALPMGGGSVVVQAALAAAQAQQEQQVHQVQQVQQVQRVHQVQAQPTQAPPPAQLHGVARSHGTVQAQPHYSEQQFAPSVDQTGQSFAWGQFPEPEPARAHPAPAPPPPPPVPGPYLVTDPYATYGQAGGVDPMTASGPLPMIDPMTASGPLPMIDPMTASGPVPVVGPMSPPAPAPAPPRGPVGYATGRTPPGVPANGGLTAAQVRGATSPAGMAFPIPAAGQSWPNAAGSMDRAG